MNYNLVFSPTAAIDRLVRNHRANAPTYFYIASIVVLSEALVTFDWASDELEKMSEKILKFRIFKLKTKRFFVRCAIALVIFSERLKAKTISVFDVVFQLN